MRVGRPRSLYEMVCLLEKIQIFLKGNEVNEGAPHCGSGFAFLILWQEI